MYNLVYKTVSENFQENVGRLEFNQLEELNEDVKTNGWSLMKIKDYN